MMQTHLKGLTGIIKDDADADKTQETITRLALILERSNGRIDEALHKSWLSDDLLKLNLPITEQSELVMCIINLLGKFPQHPHTSSLLWMIGKAHPIAAFESLQEYLLQTYKLQSVQNLYQGLVALQNCLYNKKLLGDRLTEEIFGNLIAMLKTLKKYDDDQIAKHATRTYQLLS